jgi:hypothetical protein
MAGQTTTVLCGTGDAERQYEERHILGNRMRLFAAFREVDPCLHIFDGATSHTDYSTDKDLKVITCLPKNTTHESSLWIRQCSKPSNAT